ncbi:MAG TPA: SURF1 family cytochrome oxidase biogenesis protein, partial [Kiloniellaceae bacterium]|nr:SURF1 family cytochrome oxidase biogenesis protein [Kiloniellaceae bacterium]
MSAPDTTAGGRRRFRPTLWATVCTVVALAILVALGSWQVQRLFWKEAEIAKRQERLSALAVPLPAGFPDPEEIEFTRVRLEGRFLHDEEFHVGARTENGRIGYHVVTPFALAPSSPGGGRVILVNRGWVPEDRRDPATRVEGQVEGEIAIDGLLRTGGWKSLDFARPPNKPEERFYFWLDLPVMAEAVSEGPVIT